MENLELAFEALSGKFTGKGVNHEGQALNGTFWCTKVLGGSGVGFTFHAVGKDGTVYHSESSLLGKTFQGKLALWVMSSNHPGVIERRLVSSEPLEGSGFIWTFGYGNKDDRMSFREEIRIEVHPDESVKYTYFWGIPGGDFAERSWALMELAN
jgi:hypothetical protein